MNNKIKKFTENFSYTFLANILSMFISVILVLIVPRFIGVNEYGYWQLYIFYASYMSYMSLGLTDGVYLRYGGKEYEKLERPIFVSQYWFLVLFDIIINCFIICIYISVSQSINKTIVVIFACVSSILMVPRSLLTFILQATNRIKQFAIITILEKITYFILVITILLFGIKQFQYLIIAEIIGKICSVLYAIFVCKELVFGKVASIRVVITEVWTNISVGIKLLFANLASMLIIGIIRMCIQRNWDIETFGKISLTLSISNLLMTFINSVGIVLFPILKRTSKERLSNIYIIIRTAMMIPLIGLLIFYYPAKIILSVILPQYTESLRYMGLLFPMCIYESKMILLINTYYKVLRKENVMLIINIITVILSFILAIISSFILNSLNLTILSILILLAFRCIISELYLSRLINVKTQKGIWLELLMSIVFIYISWNLNISTAIIIYICCYIVYILINRSDIKYLISNVKSILRT